MRLESSKRRWAIGSLAVGLTALAAVGGSRLSHTCCPMSATTTQALTFASQAVRSTALRIDGMTCASCSITVRLAIKKLPGVRDVKVSAEAKTAVVDYDPTKVTPEQMIEAVDRAGYQASLSSRTGA